MISPSRPEPRWDEPCKGCGKFFLYCRCDWWATWMVNMKIHPNNRFRYYDSLEFKHNDKPL